MLERVVSEVVGSEAEARYIRDPKAPRVPRVLLTAVSPPARTAVVRAGGEWFDAEMVEFGARMNIFFDDRDSDEEKESELREIVLVVRSYLRGEGTLTHRRSLILRRPRPVWTTVVHGREWTVGRTWMRYRDMS